MSSNSRRAVIYTRISLDLRDGAGVERQEVECRQWVERQGYELVEVCSDNSISAFTGKTRPGFERAVELLTTGRADVLVAWHLDRVTRQMDDLQRLMSIRGLLIDTVRGSPIDTGDASTVLGGQLLTVIAEFESSHKRERVLAAQAAKVRAGGLLPRLWGYDGNTPTDEARVSIPALFDVFVRTHNIEAARARFHELAPDAPWSRGAILSRLKQGAYAGIVEWQGAVLDVEPQWEALIDVPTFRRAQAILTSPRRRVTHHERGVALALGTGLYVCGRCGETMIAGGVVSTAEGRRPAYRCKSNAHLNRDRADIDTAVVAMLLWRLETANIGAALLPRESTGTSRVDELSRDLDTRSERLRILHEDYASGVLEPVYARPAIQNLRAEIEALNSELASLGVDPTVAPYPYSVSLTVLGIPLAALRQLLAAVMVVTLPELPPPTGMRKKGTRVGLREGSIKLEWLDEPGTDTLRGSHQVPDWTGVFNDLPLPKVPSWLLQQMDDSPLTEEVRRQVWRTISPYAVGRDWDVPGLFELNDGGVSEYGKQFE